MNRRSSVIIILFSILFSSQLYAQYSNSDYEVVRTTFTREFDKTIILDYLNSNNNVKVIASLLSISHCKDTSYVHDVLKLDFDLFGKSIAFFLGQLDRTDSSINYLLKKITSTERNPYQRECYQAFGKIANSKDLEILLEYYDNLSYQQKSGFAATLAYYFINGKTNDFNIIDKILLDELSSEDSSRIFDGLLAIARKDGLPEAKESLTKILYTCIKENYSFPILQYTLTCMRSARYFPQNNLLFKNLINNKKWNVRCEAVRTCCYYKFQNIEELKEYLNLLEDPNPNVSRQTAMSIKSLNLSDSLMIEMQKLLSNYIENETLTRNTRGELLISFCSLYPGITYQTIEKYSSIIDKKYIYSILSNYLDDPRKNFNYLLKEYDKISQLDLINLIPALLALQPQFYNDYEFTDLLLKSLKSSFPPIISITADGIDSIFISKYSEKLKPIILEQLDIILDNPEYLESIQSIERLAEKIDFNFEEEILSRLKSSKIYSIRNFAYSKLGEKINTIRMIDNFDDFWACSFKYSGCKVFTNKGEFTIKFNAEYAPISVGNFCKLAESGFYDNVTFHRVVPDFVIQAGDTSGTGWCGPGYEIISEFSTIPFEEGYVGMASSGKDTEGSQWFVMNSDYPHLNGRYSNFGKVIEGMEIVGSIDQGDKILRVELLK